MCSGVKRVELNSGAESSDFERIFRDFCFSPKSGCTRKLLLTSDERLEEKILKRIETTSFDYGKCEAIDSERTEENVEKKNEK